MRFYFFLSVVFVISLVSVADADYVTPGVGNSYSLESLASIATDVVQKEDDHTYRILDKLVIAASDELTIHDSIVTMATRYYITNTSYSIVGIDPMIEIRGQFDVDNTLFRSDETATNFHAPVGLAINSAEQLSGTIKDCTFERFLIALSINKLADITVNSCRFNECFSTAINVVSGKANISDCIFFNNRALMANGIVTMKNCRSEGGGIFLTDIDAGSEISDNVFIGPDNSGIHIVGNVKPVIERCQISGFHYGLIVGGSGEVNFTNNSIWGNEYGAMFFSNHATGTFRSNQIVHNTAEVLNKDGAESMPAISIDENATPDFGTQESPGFNIIRNNGPWTLYHFGAEDIYAAGNAWDSLNEADVEAMIYHAPDDGSDADGNEQTSGSVHYTPILNVPSNPGSADIDWSGQVDIKDLLLIQENWHQ